MICNTFHSITLQSLSDLHRGKKNLEFILFFNKRYRYKER